MKCGDTSWKVYRNQPRKFTRLDDGNAYAFVNDGSLVLCSPEVQLLFGGDGCIALKDAIAYFKQKIIAMYVQHHGNDCPESSARAAADAGVILMWETNVERNGAGTTGFTQFGSRRVRQAGQAVDTTHLTDSVTMLTKEGFELKHEVFLHEAPAPEPTEPEEVSEDTTEYSKTEDEAW